MIQNNMDEVYVVSVKKRRNIQDCKFWRPRGKRTHYCAIDKSDPLKRCYGVCKKYYNHDNNLN